MPRRRNYSPDELLQQALGLLALEIRRLRRAKRAKTFTEEDARQLVRMANCLREIEADRNRPWDPRKLACMTDHEIEAELARDLASAREEKGGN